MLAEKNVKFYMNDSVMEVRGQDGKVKEVVLKSTRVLPADVFIVGIGEFNLQLSTIIFAFLVLRYFQQSQLFILYVHSFCLLLSPGVKPNSEFLRGSRIQLDSRNFVIVDKVSRSSSFLMRFRLSLFKVLQTQLYSEKETMWR